MTMNMAVRLRTSGAKVLLVDMDPQCSLSYIMNADQPEKTVMDVLTGKAAAQEVIVHTPEGDILPASGSLSLIESQLTGKDKASRLKKALAQVAQDYHFVVIDSPPALGLLMLNVLTASDSVVIPALADVFSLQGIGQLYATIQAVKQSSNPKLEIDGILLSRDVEQTRLTRDVEQMLHATARQMGTQVFETFIRRCPTVQEAQALRQSIYQYAPGTPQAADISRFTLEYLKRLRLRLSL